MTEAVTQAVTQSIEAGLAVLRFNRPDALNALNSHLRKGIVIALEAMAAREDVRAIVLTGAGRAFAAGVDLKEAQSVRPEDVEAWFGEMRDVYHAIRMVEKPVVAAVNGVAAGAGFQMALVADFRVGCPSTRMGQPEINAGIPSVMGSFWMSLHLGLAKNMELSYTGRLMDAEECQTLGLLNRMAPDAELVAEARAMAAELAAKPQEAFRQTKRRFREVTQAAFEDAFRAAVEGQRACYEAGEPQQVMARFIAERQARKGEKPG